MPNKKTSKRKVNTETETTANKGKKAAKKGEEKKVNREIEITKIKKK